MEPWHWKPNKEQFTLEATRDGVKRIVKVYRLKYDDITTIASNRLVKNGNAMMLPHRHSKTYTFVNSLLGGQYKSFRKFLYEMRHSTVIYRRPQEYWKHPDGDITATRSAAGGITSVSFQETSDARHIASIRYQISKDSVDTQIIEEG